MDGVFAAAPIRVATEADTDQFAANRTIHGDVASFFGTASAIARNGGSGLAAYLLGAFWAIEVVTRRMHAYQQVRDVAFAVWAIAPGSDGGLAVSSIQEFFWMPVIPIFVFLGEMQFADAWLYPSGKKPFRTRSPSAVAT